MTPDPLLGAIRSLLGALVADRDEEATVARVLDALVAALGADRGLVMLTDPAGATTTIEARGPRGALSAREQAEISRTLVRDVWRSGKARLFEPDAADSRSMQTLGIACAIAAPLRAVGGEPRGVVYLDFRDLDAEVGEREVLALELAAGLLALVMDDRRALARSREDLDAALGREAVPPPNLDELLRPRAMAGLRADLEMAAASDLPLLLLGESGSGKTLLARAVAEASRRAPIVRATLGHADDLNTITSELFGHERGSFSGAHAARAGLVSHADGGTLILDEILNLPPNTQQLLLDFTQFGTYRPLGWSHAEPRHARVRLIAATNGDLDRAVEDGRFRADLYYRLSGIVVRVPALRERQDEIPELAEGILRRLDPDRAWTLGVEARRWLLAPERAWPGNLRQLELMVRRARDRALAAAPDATVIDASHLGDGKGAPRAAAPTGDLAAVWKALGDERAAIDARERALLERALADHGGVVARVAAALGLPRTSLVSRMQTLGIRGG